MISKKISGKFLTFDDVLLLPKKSPINSRAEIDLTSDLGKFKLNLPIISSPMDTVTESKMAIAMAKSGGLGIIHRFCSIEEQVEEVKKVKRAQNWIIENPITISPTTTVREILDLASFYGFNTFPVIDEQKKLLGLVCKRDYIFQEKNKKAYEIMTPYEKLILSKKILKIKEAVNLFKKFRIEKIPIVDNERKLIGLITAKDVGSVTDPKVLKDKKGKLLVGAALGIKGDFLERAKELVKAGCDILVIDVAHGHLVKTLKAVKKIKNNFPNIPLIAGNVATPEGAKDLISSGADIVKVGIGPGSICSTRIVSGVGVPQLSAILWIREKIKNAYIIADGGCKNSGDIVKALAAGANAVMLGSLLAGTKEAPGKVVFLNGKRVKLFRGMSSVLAYENKLEKTREDKNYLPISEGLDIGYVPYKGGVSLILEDLEKGIRSGFSYCGARNIKELWKNAEFIEISYGGIKESGFHNVIIG